MAEEVDWWVFILATVLRRMCAGCLSCALRAKAFSVQQGRRLKLQLFWRLEKLGGDFSVPSPATQLPRCNHPKTSSFLLSRVTPAPAPTTSPTSPCIHCLPRRHHGSARSIECCRKSRYTGCSDFQRRRRPRHPQTPAQTPHPTVRSPPHNHHHGRKAPTSRWPGPQRRC